MRETDRIKSQRFTQNCAYTMSKIHSVVNAKQAWEVSFWMRTSKFKATREPTNQQQQQPASIKAKKTKMKRKRKGKLENPSYISRSHIYLCTQYIHHSIHTLLLIYATYCFSLMCPLVLHIYIHACMLPFLLTWTRSRHTYTVAYTRHSVWRCSRAVAAVACGQPVRPFASTPPFFLSRAA